MIVQSAARRRLEIEATAGSLPGLLNRRVVVERAESELRRLKRRGAPACLSLCDIDRFKRINDTHGYPTGDKVLIDFAVLVPDEHLGNGSGIAEKVRAAVAFSDVLDGAVTINPTASFGMTDPRADDPGLSIAMKRADEALYAAKENGRNRVEIHPVPETDTPSNVRRMGKG